MRSTLPPDRTEQVSGIVFATVVLAAWELLSRTGVIDPLVLPAPSAIIATLVTNLLGFGSKGYPIAANTLASLKMLSIGFVLGALLGVAFGLIIGLSNTAYRIAGPILGLLVPVPAIAWAPISMVWLGLGPPTIIAIVTYACFSEVVYNTAAGVRGTPVRFLWVVKSFGAPRLMQLRHVVLPGAFPQIFVGLKLGLGASWRALIGAEMVAEVASGLGFMMYQASEFYATDVLIHHEAETRGNSSDHFGANQRPPARANSRFSSRQISAGMRRAGGVATCIRRGAPKLLDHPQKPDRRAAHARLCVVDHL